MKRPVDPKRPLAILTVVLALALLAALLWGRYRGVEPLPLRTEEAKAFAQEIKALGADRVSVRYGTPSGRRSPSRERTSPRRRRRRSGRGPWTCWRTPPFRRALPGPMPPATPPPLRPSIRRRGRCPTPQSSPR